MSSLVFTLESHPKSKWGLYGSYVMAAANFGTLLGGIIGFTMREALEPEQLLTWGWRIPFLSGILVIDSPKIILIFFFIKTIRGWDIQEFFLSLFIVVFVHKNCYDLFINST